MRATRSLAIRLKAFYSLIKPFVGQRSVESYAFTSHQVKIKRSTHSLNRLSGRDLLHAMRSLAIRLKAFYSLIKPFVGRRSVESYALTSHQVKKRSTHSLNRLSGRDLLRAMRSLAIRLKALYLLIKPFVGQRTVESYAFTSHQVKIKRSTHSLNRFSGRDLLKAMRSLATRLKVFYSLIKPFVGQRSVESYAFASHQIKSVLLAH